MIVFDIQDSTSGSLASPVAITSSDWPTSERARPAHRMATFPLPLPPRGPLAAPHEGRRILVPMPRHQTEPVDDLARACRVLAVQRSPLEHPLNALGHVQPR